MNMTRPVEGVEELIDQHRAVMDLLVDAMEAMRDAMPHGRDYIGKPERYEADRELWQVRYDSIKAIRDGLLQEALALYSGRY